MMNLLLLAALMGPSASTAITPDSTESTAPMAAASSLASAFGSSLALSGDYAFVGEPRGGPSGQVHVYRRGTAGWRAASKIASPSGSPNDGFGVSVAADGQMLLVGRVGAPNGADSARGSVHVYRRTAAGAYESLASWNEAGLVARASYGSALLIRGDMAFVGAPRQENGAVFMYRRGADGSWTPAGRVPAPDLTEGDLFGSALAMDGNRLVIGAPGRSTAKGAVFVYTVSGNTVTPAGMLVSATATDGSLLGTSVAISGSRIVAGAPGAFPTAGRRGASLGSVTTFEYSEVSEIWRERQSFMPFEAGASRFGASLAAAGTELWVGAPVSQYGAGRIYRVQPDAQGGWGAMTALAVGDIDAGAGFGASIVVAGNTAAVGMPNDGGGGGTVMFLSRNATGAWRSTGTVFPEPDTKTFAAVKGKEVMCGDEGKAGEFECGNASLLSFLPIAEIGGKRGTSMNDNWGWTDPQTNREIAILGRTDGTSFVDVTDPANPRYLGDLPKTKGTPSAAWRDMKVVKNHVFIVADNAGEHGMQVFDLTRLRTVRTPQTFTPDLIYDRINSAHNIVANEATGFVYVVGGSGGGETCGGGHHMIDVNDPKKPKFAGCFGDDKTGRAGTGYSHDSQCVLYRGPDTRYAGKEICVGSNETAISIADVTDKKNPVAISRASYPNVAYAHQAWLTDDHKYLYLNDEGDESSGQGEAAKGTRTLVWDVQDLTDPVLVKEHVGTTKAIDHNLYVKGDRMYQANYTSGLRILDISDPRNPKEVGFLDTHPGDDGTPSFSGSWSVYPYFKSGAIVVTSIGEGVFFVRDRTRPVVQ